jgi:exonuclease I
MYAPKFILKVPYVDPAYATKWHPTESTGPFAVLVRGAFVTQGEGIEWARKHLNGTPYTLTLEES